MIFLIPKQKCFATDIFTVVVESQIPTKDYDEIYIDIELNVHMCIW